MSEFQWPTSWVQFCDPWEEGCYHCEWEALNKFIQIGWVPPHLPHRLCLQALEMEASLCGPGCPLPPWGVHSVGTAIRGQAAESWKGSQSQLSHLTQDLCFYHGSKICAVHCQLARLEVGERTGSLGIPPPFCIQSYVTGMCISFSLQFALYREHRHSLQSKLLKARKGALYYKNRRKTSLPFISGSPKTSFQVLLCVWKD